MDLKIYLLSILFISTFINGLSQNNNKIFRLSGIIYDEEFNPLISAHVINLSSKQIDITDSDGVFQIKIKSGDSILIKNISYRDTIIRIGNPVMIYTIKLKKEIYPINELRVFKWGSTYHDMKRAFLAMPSEVNLQDKLGLSKSDPDAIPFYLDEEKIKSPGFAVKSPVSFLYYNFNKFEKSRRRVYRLNETKSRREAFYLIVNRKRVAEITGLENTELKDFWIYLNEHISCDINCTEYEIITEIIELYGYWKRL